MTWDYDKTEYKKQAEGDPVWELERLVNYGLGKEKINRKKLEKHLEKILAHARAEGSVTNSDVVKLLRVSDATASRYLAALVSRGQLVQNGKGRSVSYTAA